ncbi:MAG TPA: cation:proton antiporter, partial [Gammaproteobacteria bacterium]|nr:cation:proton antiporter [Gammaproteobacteria bacterium]
MYNDILFLLVIIFCGAALFATLALYTRQSMLVAYIILGILFGPAGIKLISDTTLISEVGDVGIIFLLFLLGLNLQPQNLLKLIREATAITLISSIIFGGVGFGIGILIGFNLIESIVVGACMMFSSTIIGLKLLPTTVLHHQRIGEIVISILLLQDIIAIFTLLLFHAASTDGGVSLAEFAKVFIALPALIVFAFVFERYVLKPIFKRFNRIHEYIFLIAIGWCLALGQLAHILNLSFEIGAFIAGISLAASPISRFI